MQSSSPISAVMASVDPNDITLDGASITEASITETWTCEEIKAASDTKLILIKDKEFDNKWISPRELWLCVVNSKFRPAKAAEK
jgi:hypothetical protein